MVFQKTQSLISSVVLAPMGRRKVGHMTTVCSVVRVCPSHPTYGVIALLCCSCYLPNLPLTYRKMFVHLLFLMEIFYSFLSLLCSWGFGEAERWACPTGGEGGGSVPGRVGDSEGWMVGGGGCLRCMPTAGIPLCTGDEFLSFRNLTKFNTASNKKLASFPGPAHLSVACSTEKRERAWYIFSREWRHG